MTPSQQIYLIQSIGVSSKFQNKAVISFFLTREALLRGCLNRPSAADDAKKYFVILFHCQRRRNTFETGSEGIFS
jgi:hypothetical protein